ncbi:MAG: type II toxin-antitoxin system RelE/ParE family toxin [Anaerococcus vaginalis]
MYEFKVEFYESENGKIPVEEFLNSLPKKLRAKSLGTIEILQTFGNELRGPYSKNVEKDIFELRTKIGTDITRIFYFFYYDKRIILTNGFIKKTQKTPRKEIEKAIKYRKDFIEREKNENI